MDWLDTITGDPALVRLAALAEAGGSASALGVCGSSAVVTAAALHRRTGRPILLVVAHLDDADEAADELSGLGLSAARFPALELLPGESAVSLEQLSERLTLLRLLRRADATQPPVLVAPIHALMQGVPAADDLERLMRVLRPGDRVDLEKLAAWLVDSGYARVEAIEGAGEFAIRGGIVDVFPPSGAAVRMDLFGDGIEALFEIDLDTMGSDRRLDRVEIVGLGRAGRLDPSLTAASFLETLPRGTVALLVEIAEIAEQGRSYLERASDASALSTVDEVFAAAAKHGHAVIDLSRFNSGSGPQRSVTLPVAALPAFDEVVSAAVLELAELARESRTIVLAQNEGERQRMEELLSEVIPRAGAVPGAGDGVEVQTRYLHRGFLWTATPRKLALVPYHELLHRYQVRRRMGRVAARSTDTFLDLEAGDYVVHRDHGVARFLGIGRLKGGSPGTSTGGDEEYLSLEFEGGTRLHVPASKIELVHRYVGAFQGAPQLSRYGGKRWERQKQEVSEAVRELAGEMLRIQAARAASPGIRFPADTTWQKEFEAAFPYEETPDQLAAIAEIKADMADTQPMDRLICGDVGFGKTEVAIRAAFKAAEYGKQVAILVPTTVLAEQHERTCRQRFADYPFRIESLSRFKTRREQQQVLDLLSKGQVDIIIGTHRLLSKDVRFSDLGLVIIDEEQRFGVKHKTRLLQFRMTADVLTLSATPIPRTLHMALLGLRDISSLTTAPLDRRAIVTEVIADDPVRLKRAIERELAREGQVFYVHNRVHSIAVAADRVRTLAPGARILIGHGQMPSRQLESVMLRFMRREADILVCTTIIESGIDIPTVNTMVIDDADMFGLSELHQLRGRVGRYKHRAYCYLLMPRDRVINEVAKRRLRAIEQFSMLGAGFKIAMRDLEIRGAGNLLGAEQSGHIAAVGYEMYCRLLERSVAELRQEDRVASIDTALEIGITGSIPKGYIPSDARRMEAYRRASAADELADLDRLEADLRSAYGDPPARVVTLLRVARLRVAAARLGVKSVTRRGPDIVFHTLRPGDLEPCFAGGPAGGTLRVVGQPDARGLAEVYYRPPPASLEGETILTVLLKRLVPEPVPA